MVEAIVILFALGNWNLAIVSGTINFEDGRNSPLYPTPPPASSGEHDRRTPNCDIPHVDQLLNDGLFQAQQDIALQCPRVFSENIWSRYRRPLWRDNLMQESTPAHS